MLDASATGDVLFAASVLRTMLEEVGRLAALDLGSDQLKALVGGDQTAQSKVRKYMGAAWTSVCDLSNLALLEDQVARKAEKRIVLSSRAKKVQGRLNGFVHPNYGSHVAVLYPDGLETAALLLEAICAVYESFENLSFSPEAPHPLAAAESLHWSRGQVVDAFVTGPLATLSKALEASSHEPPFDPGQVSAELTREPSWTLIQEGPPDDLLVDMPARASEDERGYRVWEGAQQADIFLIAFARRAERKLSRSFAQGRPKSLRQEQLAFDMAALELAITSTQAKIASLRMQLVRQTVAMQPLGIWLIIRALVEQWALILWLPAAIERALDIAANDASDLALEDALSSVFNAIAEYLATQADDASLEARPWSVDASGTALGRIRLSDVTNSTIPNDDFWGKQYALGSAVMHGRKAQALELATSRELLGEQAALSGALVVSRLSAEWDWSLRMGSLLERLKHACFANAEAVGEGGAHWAFGLGKAGLVQGDDYYGAGTRDDPFVIASHVHFYVGSHWLAHQTLQIAPEAELGSQNLAQWLDRREDGCLLDCWSAGDNRCWIKVELNPDLKTDDDPQGS